MLGHHPHRQEVKFTVSCTNGLKDEGDARQLTPLSVFDHGLREPVKTSGVLLDVYNNSSSNLKRNFYD